VARPKRVITQRNFSAGELRDAFLERDDVEMRQFSLQRATNTFIGPTQTIAARPGTRYLRTINGARQIVEIRPAAGRTYALVIGNERFDVLNADGTTEYSRASVAWSDAGACWVLPLGAETIIGHPDHGMFVLSYSNDEWSYGAFEFAEGAGNTTLQPYFKFPTKAKIKPSATTGTITVDASQSAFAASQVGSKIRYGEREILITGFTSATRVTGTVVSALPPSYRLTVSSTAELNVNDVVIGQDSGFTGVITYIASGGTTFRVLTLENWDGPLANEKISAPQVTLTVTAKTLLEPEETQYWDEPLFSNRRKWPSVAEWAAGRLWLAGSASKRNVVAASSVRAANDFEIGAEDDDAILRTVGQDGTRIRHIVDAGDILFFADRGMHYQERRQNGNLTPSNFAPILFDERGCSTVRPAIVERGVVFVEEGGTSICAALLDGNVYLTWTVRSLTTFCSHLINAPVALCGPPLAPNRPDRLLLVVNGNGTIAAMSYTTILGQESVGFVPWTTDGNWVGAAPVFGGYWVMVDRQTDTARRMIERLDFAQYLDSTVIADPQSSRAAPHLESKTVHVLDGGNYAGMSEVGPNGNLIETFQDVDRECSIGLNFTVEARVWPAEVMESFSAGMRRQRVLNFIVSVLRTRHLEVQCNDHARQLGGYRVGDDLSDPAAARTRVYRVPVFGRRDHATLAVRRRIPGPWHVLSIGQEVEA
jgi:hypothetical protein